MRPHVAVYKDGHWVTSVEFRSRLLAFLFHTLLNKSTNHAGSRYY